MSGYFTGVVADNADPEQRGRLLLVVGAIHEGAPLPDWIEHDAPAGPALQWIPARDSIVRVRQTAGGDLRWMGGPMEGSQAWPAPLLKGYPERAGVAGNDGAACLVLEGGGGVLVLAGPGRGVVLARTESGLLEPIPLADSLALWLEQLTLAVQVFAAAAKVAIIEPALGPAATALESSILALPPTSMWKSSVSKTE